MKNTWLTKIAMFVALFLAYMKTAEAMVHFAPHAFLGWSDPILPVLWGYVCAGLVEGVALYAFGNWEQSNKDTPTRAVSIAVTGLAVAFSILMNIIDQQINDGSFRLDAGVPVVGFLFSTMGLIPIITGIMFGVMRLVDAHFPDRGGNNGGGKQKNKGGGGEPNFGSMPRMPSMSEFEPEHQRMTMERPSLPDPRQGRPLTQPESRSMRPSNGSNGHNQNGGRPVGPPARMFEDSVEPLPRLTRASDVAGDAGEHPTPPRA